MCSVLYVVAVSYFRAGSFFGSAYVVPDGPVHRLNLETLVAPSPQPHYWIEDAEVAVSPSIAIAMAKKSTRFFPIR